MNANSQAPNYGSRVLVDTALGPVPVYRAPKSLPHGPDSWISSLHEHSDVHPAQELHLRHFQDLSCATTGMSTTRQELQL